MPAVIDPAKILEAAAALQRNKDAEYGERWRDFGNLVLTLFPNGIKISNARDASRYALLTWMLSKLSRYAANFEAGGHDDSLVDLAVYAAMLAALDREGEDDRHRDGAEPK